MHSSVSRIIAHVDMDAFFASVEARNHPEWKNEPIVVCVFSGRTKDSGVVSSASYVARKQGVKAGMPIVKAKQKCPNGKFLPVDIGSYSQVSEEVFSRLESHVDIVEKSSIDEVYADLSHSCVSMTDAEIVLKTFQSDLKKELNLSCSIGLSTNKLIAKIASDERKPFGFTCVDENNIQSFLDNLPVARIPGIGPKATEILHEQNIQIIREARVQTRNQLIQWFGSARGNLFFDYFRGKDISPVSPRGERKNSSHINTLVRDAFALEDIMDVLESQVTRLWDSSLHASKWFTQISVTGITPAQEVFSKSKTLVLPCETREQFTTHVYTLFHKLFEQEKNVLPFRRIGIRIGGFVPVTLSTQRHSTLRDF